MWIVESVQVVVKFCFRHQDDDENGLGEELTTYYLDPLLYVSDFLSNYPYELPY